MSDRPDDLTLVAACREGRTEAFGELVRRYQDRLYPTLYRLTGSADDALDLVQDAFLRAYERLDRFDGESGFYTWLYRIAVNLAISARRRRKVVGRSPASLSANMPEPADDLASSDPSRPVLIGERDRIIQTALDELPTDYRAVIVLNHLDGLSYDEIARALGIPVGTVRSRLHRARSELRDRLRVALDERPAAVPPSVG